MSQDNKPVETTESNTTERATCATFALMGVHHTKQEAIDRAARHIVDRATRHRRGCSDREDLLRDLESIEDAASELRDINESSKEHYYY